MTVSPVPFESLTALSRAVDVHLANRGMRVRTSVFNLCIEAVSFGREAEDDLVGTRTRSAAHLLLELSCPELDDTTLTELSVACERAALGRR
jgi:hypothetical protein